MKGLSSQRIALKGDVLQDQKIDCLQARPCIFQPGNLTGWGNSEGVKFRSQTEVRSSLKVEVAVLGSPSLIVLTVSVDVEHHVYLHLLTVKAACDKRAVSLLDRCVSRQK